MAKSIKIDLERRMGFSIEVVSVEIDEPTSQEAYEVIKLGQTAIHGVWSVSIEEEKEGDLI